MENEKFKELLDRVDAMSVLELNELVKALEQKFGVSAQAVVAAGPASGAAVVEEKDAFDLHLTSGGDKKIQVIKVVKEILNLGLKEAKDLVDAAPALLKQGVKKADADEIKKKIEEAGGKVELK